MDESAKKPEEEELSGDELKTAANRLRLAVKKYRGRRLRYAVSHKSLHSILKIIITDLYFYTLTRGFLRKLRNRKEEITRNLLLSTADEALLPRSRLPSFASFSRLDEWLWNDVPV